MHGHHVARQPARPSEVSQSVVDGSILTSAERRAAIKEAKGPLSLLAVGMCVGSGLWVLLLSLRRHLALRLTVLLSHYV